MESCGGNPSKPVAEHAGQRGVQLAIEPLNRFETDFINTVEQGLDLIERIDASNVGFLLDTFHMNVEEEDIPERFVMRDPRSSTFTPAKMTAALPGTGHVEWKEVVSALREIN